MKLAHLSSAALVSVFGVCLSAACGGGGSASPSLDRASLPRDEVVSADIPTAVAASNAFAIDLYGKASASAQGSNFLMSPLSANLALTMTYAGAQGETQSQMASVLHIPSSGSSIFDAQNALTQELDGEAAKAYASASGDGMPGEDAGASSSDYVIEVVNSVWGEDGYPWASSFLDTLSRSYGTGVYQENFSGDPPAAEAAINTWVSDQTSGKIDPLLGPGAIDASTRLVLVNAVHVKLPWANPFVPSSAATGKFTRGDRTVVEPSFMNQTFTSDNASPVGYAETSDGQFLSMPLAGGVMSAVFVLPRKDLATLSASLTSKSWRIPATGDEIVLSLPKFTMQAPTFDLSQPLQQLGMTDAFDPSKADFLGMCSDKSACTGLYVGFVLQKATIDVAENGVEAAAATAVGVEMSATENPTIVNLTFDRPFMVSLVDSSGAILLLGQVDDPTATGG